MSDILEDDLEFRGGTLQLSTDNSAVGVVENQPSVTTDSTRKQSQGNVHPSVLSGADSLTSSTNSFADARTQEQQNASGLSPTESQTVYPRYDVPFNKENIKDFFTFRKGVVEAAIQECITILLFPEDGEYLGSWLLTEITLWDNEKERIVLLTSRLVMTIKYDFIAMKQLDFKKTYLDDLDTIVIGELVYPPSSLVPERNLRGVRLMWNKGEPLPLKTVWNPFSQDVPFLTFASHPIYWHKDGGVEERATYDMETFAQKLQRAIEIMPSSSCCIHHSPIVIQSYVGLTSMLHNKTSMGFFKVRGKFSF
ncbi:tumor protein p63-regulated gene 1-like protein isoform X4 [Bombyx mandarina]|uniref:HSac2 domain-containing protein n=2 Tax=Bombyx TaxID=7090 RepID=A0A8R2G9J0_BOMMO|nr:tumor protein p63-regulated gene 1-like protein isoform X4 [Bombyx mori]XP_028038276.1 tumor protein p63-regulated gene 1-like protein isoform X4 [Bombyx mandarina]